MDIYDKVQEIAKQKGISIYRIERDLDLANGTISKWNKSVPNADNLLKVSDYLNVDYREFINTANK